MDKKLVKKFICFSDNINNLNKISQKLYTFCDKIFLEENYEKIY